MRLSAYVFRCLSALALLVAASYAHAAPASSPQESLPVVGVNDDRAEKLMLGFMVVGTDQQKKAIEKAATAIGFEHGEAENDRQQPELMVFFQKAVPVARAADLYRRVLAGEFGSVAVEVLVAPMIRAGEKVNIDDVRVFGSTEVKILSPNVEVNAD